MIAGHWWHSTCSIDCEAGGRCLNPDCSRRVAAERDRATEVEAAEDRAEQAAFDSMREAR